MNYSTPSGFRDVLIDEAKLRENIIYQVQQLFADAGYNPIETPTLEVMDVLRAGGRLPASPFKFFDSCGDLLAMRPDVTQQVARMCATRIDAEDDPLRLRYTQRVFRESYVPSQEAAREVTQIGIECIGSGGSCADTEVISLFAKALQVCGVDGYRLSIATVAVLRELLIASGADKLWQDAVLEAFHASNFVALDRLCSGAKCDAQAAYSEAMPPCDIGVQDNLSADYADAIAKLARIRGGREAIDQVRALVDPLCRNIDALDALSYTFDALCEAGLGSRIVIDFSVMSSFDYYTGVVFEAYAPGSGTPLGSGGRYDTLLAAYGKSRPAAGFAFCLEEVLSARADAKDTTPKNAKTCSARPLCDRAESYRLDTPLRIAVPKGSLNAGTIAVLAKCGLDITGLDAPGRKLIIHVPGIDYVIVRPSDAPVFVALGACDCGICGADSLLEADVDTVELVDLLFGACRFVVAEPSGAAGATKQHLRRVGSIRVATKYPKIARAFFAKKGIQVEIVQLRGNIELAPLTGMAERILDITATGTTLEENNLVVVDEVLSSTARFFANTSAFRTDERVCDLARRLRAAVQTG